MIVSPETWLRLPMWLGLQGVVNAERCVREIGDQVHDGAAYAAPCQTCYLTTDHLGSVRAVTSEALAVVGRHDYLPFGEEIPASTAGRNESFGGFENVRQRFTGQERDDTNLDYFEARYLASVQGRFLSPDPANAGADLLNPQSWNGYSYVLNNPVANVDPTGLTTCDSNGDNCRDSIDVNGGSNDPIDTFPIDYYCRYVLSCGDGFGSGGGSGGSQAPTIMSPVVNKVQPPKIGSCTSGAGSNSGSAWSEMFSALGSWLTSGPKYIHYGPSDPYTKDFVKSSAMLYVNNSISGSQASSGRVAVGTGRAFLFTVLDALAGSPSISEAQFGAFVATYSRSGSGMAITLTNDISNNSAFYHIPSGLSMSGSYADRFGRLTGRVPTGAVLQEMTIRRCP